MAGEKWENRFRKPFPKQKITVLAPDEKTSWRRERQRMREEEAWEMPESLESFKSWCGWMNWSTGDTDPRSTTITLSCSGFSGHLVTRVPKDSEWAFIKSFANQKFGEGTWIATLRGEWWRNHKLAHRYGEIVRILRSEDISAAARLTEKTTKVEESTEEAQITVFEEENTQVFPSPERMGALRAPLEKIQIEVPRPLPEKERDLNVQDQVVVELGEPPIEILRPEVEDPIRMEEQPLTVLSCVKWKSKFQPDLLREEMERCPREAMGPAQPRQGTGFFDLDIRQRFEQAYRAK
jgi:hypothetical protein